jgi:pilus assembly protein CpaB
MARISEMTSSRGNRLLLGLALAAGAVAAVLVFVALSSDDDGGGTVSGGASTSVVVAAQDINAGTVISSDMVKNVEVAEDDLINGAITDSAAVVGEAARYKIYEGEQVATGKVGAENDTEGLSGVVPLGMRGFSVGVEEVRAVGGLLRPGNRVDVYISRTIENDLGNDNDDTVVSFLLLQDIEVLAVAQEAQEPNATSTDESSSGSTTTSGTLPDEVDEQPDAASVTLAVTPEQAGILVCAQSTSGAGNHGDDSVWVALRGFGEPAAEPHTVFDVCGKQF